MLKQKAITATLWSGADIFLRQGLQFIIAIVLARLLTPEEFGTIALLYLFVGLASAFVDSGFSAALIQRQDVTHTDESTVFWFNLGMGTVMATGLWLLAPWIAHFYNLPVLIPLTGLLAFNLLVSALGSIHGTLLTKRLDFKTPLKIGAIATTISGVGGVVMAWQGYGVWALAMQTLVSTFLTTTLLWIFNKWRPGLEFSMGSARKLFGFGGYLLMSGLLDIAYERIYTLLIGKFYGVRELGFYNRADGTKQLPVGVLTGILSRVALPIFSVASDDKEKLRRGVRHALRGIMLINIPMMLGIMATAEPLVETLFGTQWLPSVPILRVLCLAGMLWPLHVINLNVLMAQGHSKLFFRLEVIKKIVGAGLLIVGTAYGVMGIAWSQVVFGVLAFGINAHYTRIYLNYNTWQQIADFLPALSVATFMALLVYGLGYLLSWDASLKLLVLVLAGVAIFILVCHLFRLQAYRDARAILGDRFTKSSAVRKSV
ncbi:MOP flippase family protein [Nitrosomonas sp. wSCUT-2]